MNFGQYLATGETASSLKWWVEHPASPVPVAKAKNGMPSIGSWRRPAGWKKK